MSSDREEDWMPESGPGHGESVPLSPDLLSESVRVEASFVGALLLDPKMIDVCGFVDRDDFAEAIIGDVFVRLRTLRSERQPIDAIQIIRGLRASGYETDPVLEALGIMRSHATIDPRSLGEEVRDFAMRRRLAGLAARIASAAIDRHDDVAEMIGRLQTSGDEMMARLRTQGRTVWHWHDLADAVVKHVSGQTPREVVPSGLIDFDRLLGGHPLGEYWMLAGRPSMGKSAVAVSLVRSIARQGHGVFLASLEMSALPLAARLVTDAAWTSSDPIPYADVMRQQTEERQTRRIQEAAARERGLPIVVETRPGLTVGEVAAGVRAARARLAQQGQTLTYVVVDHLGKLRASREHRSRVNEIGEISQSLACLAKEEGVALLALCQLNRSVEGRENKRPGLADLRDSGDLEQDADLVAFAFRPAYYLERTRENDPEAETDRYAMLGQVKHDLEIIVAKNRNGPTGVVDLWIDIAANAVRNRG